MKYLSIITLIIIGLWGVGGTSASLEDLVLNKLNGAWQNVDTDVIVRFDKDQMIYSCCVIKGSRPNFEPKFELEGIDNHIVMLSLITYSRGFPNPVIKTPMVVTMHSSFLSDETIMIMLCDFYYDCPVNSHRYSNAEELGWRTGEYVRVSEDD